MGTATQTLPEARGPYRLYAEVVPGTGVPVVLMHGFPRQHPPLRPALPHMAGRRPVVRFDFLGWGRSDKPPGYPYTAANQAGDAAAKVMILSGLVFGRQLRRQQVTVRGITTITRPGDRRGAVGRRAGCS